MAFLLHIISIILFFRWMIGSFAIDIKERAFGRFTSDQALHEIGGWFFKQFIPWLICFGFAMLYTLAEIG